MSHEQQRVKNKDHVKFVTIRLALAIWCLTSPPPRMIIPVLLANTAWLFSFRISEIKNPHLQYDQQVMLRLPWQPCSNVVFYLPLCPKSSQGFCTSESRACRPESRLSEQDWTLECYSGKEDKQHIYSQARIYCMYMFNIESEAKEEGSNK